MKRPSLGTALVFLLHSAVVAGALPAAPPTPSQRAPATGSGSVVVTHLANEGFHIRSGGTAVLIDALFGDGINGYPTVPVATRRALEAALPPFDEVDLVLATHQHADHFDADAVRQFLSANPRAVFISTPQAVARLRRLPTDLDDRVRAVLPVTDTAESLEIGEIRLRIFNLHHGGGTTAQNLGFEIGIGGRKILHVGDTEVSAAQIATLHLDRAGIDLALLPSWILSKHRLVLDGIGAHRLGLMHVPSADAPPGWFGAPGNADGLVSELQETYPDLVPFLEPGKALVLAGDQP